MNTQPNKFLAYKRFLNVQTPITRLISQQPKLSVLSDNEDKLITLVDNQSSLTTLATIQTQLSTLAGDNTQLTSLVGNYSALSTLAAIQSQISSLVANLTALNTLASQQTQLSSLATNSTPLNTLASQQTQVSSLATNSSALNTLASQQTQISSLATNSTPLNILASQQYTITNLYEFSSFVNNLNGIYTAPNPNYGISYDQASIFLNYNIWFNSQYLIPSNAIASDLSSFFGFSGSVSSSVAFPSSQQNILYLTICAISTRHGGLDGTRATLLNNIVSHIDSIISTNFGSVSSSLTGQQITYLTAYINLFINSYIIDGTIAGYMNQMLSGTGITLVTSDPYSFFSQSNATSLLSNLSGPLTGTMITGLNGFINGSSTTLSTIFTINNIFYAGFTQTTLSSGHYLSVDQYNILINYFSGLTINSYCLVDSTNQTSLSSFLSNAFTITYPITSDQVNTFKQVLFYYTNINNFFSAGITSIQATALNNLVRDSLGTIIAGIPLTPFQIGIFSSCVNAISGKSISSTIATDLSNILNLTISTSGITSGQATYINTLLTDTTNIHNILSQTSTVLPTNSGTATAASAIQALAQALLLAGWGTSGKQTSMSISGLSFT